MPRLRAGRHESTCIAENWLEGVDSRSLDRSKASWSRRDLLAPCVILGRRGERRDERTREEGGRGRMRGGEGMEHGMIRSHISQLLGHNKTDTGANSAEPSGNNPSAFHLIAFLMC